MSLSDAAHCCKCLWKKFFAHFYWKKVSCFEKLKLFGGFFCRSRQSSGTIQYMLLTMNFFLFFGNEKICKTV